MGKVDPKTVHFKDLIFATTASFVDHFKPDPATPSRPQTAADTSSVFNANQEKESFRKGSSYQSTDSLRLGSTSSDYAKSSTPRVVKALFSFTMPQSQPGTKLIVTSETTAKIISVDPNSLKSPSSIEYLSGNSCHSAAAPYASNYAGHQYGIYSGQLGDGRTVTLGEIISTHDGSKWEIQLKGAGPTCYSRGGDGLVSLGSALWEFVMTEFLTHLGIPSIQSLSVVATSNLALKYTASPKPAAVLCRIAPSWIRFGTFELLHYREDQEQLKQLADYVIERFYPKAIEEEFQQELHTKALMVKPEAIPTDAGTNTRATGEFQAPETIVRLNRYAIFYRLVVKKTAALIASWQAHGFVHGAMSTDNMSIIGLTLHVGSSCFMDAYDPEFTPNQNDIDQQYRFENQPASAQWNLSRFGRTLVELISREQAPNMPSHSQQNHKYGYSHSVSTGTKTTFDSHENASLSSKSKKSIPSLPSQRKYRLGFLFDASVGENIVREITREFETYFIDEFTRIMSLKLGLLQRKETDMDRVIIPLLDLMATVGVDYTGFFRLLSNLRLSEPHFSQSVQYDPQSRHASESLLTKEQCSTPLELLLKTLLRRQREEDEYLARSQLKASTKNLAQQNSVNVSLPAIDSQTNTNSLQKSKSKDELKQLDGAKSKQLPKADSKAQLHTIHASDTKTSSNHRMHSEHDDISHLPSANEVATLWKYWAQMYRARILQELPSEKKLNVAALDVEDQNRAARMRKINPKHVPRTYLLKELVEKLNTQFTPVVTRGGVGAARKQEMKHSGDPAIKEETDDAAGQRPPLEDEEHQDVTQFVNVLIRDMWGDVSESNAKSPWETEKMRILAKKLEVEPSPVKYPRLF